MKNKYLIYTLWILGIGWVLFSLYYIGTDFASKYQSNVIENTYKKGYTDSITSLITEAKKCQPVTAYSGEDKVDLIWTDCLQKDSTNQ